MEEKTKKPTELCLCGKKINIERIMEKSQAQFANQLRMNGIELPETELANLYQVLTATPQTEEKAQE